MRIRLKNTPRRTLVIKSSRKAVLIKPLTAALLVLGSALIPLYSQMSSALTAESIDLKPVSENRGIGGEDRYVVVDGNISYQVDTATGELVAMDISNINDQKLISVANGDYKYWPDNIVKIGNYVYTSLNQPSGGKLITSYDVSDPANMFQVDTLTDPVLTACSVIYATDSQLVANNRCNAKMYVINTTDPANLSIAGSFDYTAYTDPANPAKPSSPYPTTYGDSFVLPFSYHSTSTSPYLYIEIDVSIPTNPVLEAAISTSSLGLTTSYNTFRGEVSVVRNANYAYVIHQVDLGDTDFYTINVTNPSIPVVAYSNKSMPKCWFESLALASPNQLYLGCTHSPGLGLNNAMINITNPLSPVIGENFSVLTGTWIFAGIDNGKLYNFQGYNQLELVAHDISDPTKTPAFIGGDLTNNSNWDINHTVIPNSNTAIIVSTENPTAQTIDISNPSDIKIIKNHFLTDSNQQLPRDYRLREDPQLSSSKNLMFMTELGAYMAATEEDYTGHLTIVDISDLNNLKIASRTAMPSDEFLIDGKVIGDKWYVLTINHDTGKTNLRIYQINETTKSVSLLDSQALLTTNGPVQTPYTRDVEVVNGKAIITTGGQSIEVLDVSNPSVIGAPTAGNLPTLNNYELGNPYSHGGNLLVPVRGWLYSLDTTNPLAMTISSSIENAAFIPKTYDRAHSDWEHLQFDETNNRLIYSNREADSYVRLDASDTENLTVIDSVVDTGLLDPLFDGWDDMAPKPIFYGNYAFGVSSIAEGNFYSFDTTSLAAPKPLDVIAALVPISYPTSISFYDKYAYVGSQGSWEVDSELSAYDISDVNNPQYVGGPIHDFNGVIDSKIKGNYMYAIRSEADLSVYDLSNPTFPLVISKDIGNMSSSWWSSDIHDLEIVGDYIYIAHGIDGLVTYDISDPRNPVYLGSFKDASFTGLLDLEINGNYLYGVAADGKNIVTFDVSNPTSPVNTGLTTRPQFDGLKNLHIDKGYLYVTGHGDTTGANLTIMGMADPTSIVEVGNYVGDVGAQYTNVRIHENYAFVAATGTNSIDIIDVSQKSNPQYLKQVTDSSFQGIHTLEIREGLIHFLSTDSHSYDIYDIMINGASAHQAFLSGGVGSTPPTGGSPASEPDSDSSITIPEGVDRLASTGSPVLVIIVAGLALVGLAVTILVRRR